ncbi:carbohydrate-binding family 9-like protein [Paenibacillus harenae]
MPPERTPAPHYLSWLPIDTELPNHHRSDSFGALMLGPVTGSL